MRQIVRLPMVPLRHALLRLLAGLSVLSLVMAGYVVWARPAQLSWGATQEELSRPMPGDELDADPTFLATRAITIDGTAQEIWPWLVQMGYDRAGYYGYDLIENLGSDTGPDSATRIVPELQQARVGDEIPISAAGSWVVYAIEPDHYLVWTDDAATSSYTWELYPIDAERTRLVSRIRWTHHWTPPEQLGADLFTEFTDGPAVRKILLGVQGRVEDRIEPTAQTNIELVAFACVALTFAAAIALLVARPFSRRRWSTAAATGAAWLLTWYLPVPGWFGLILLLAGGYGLWRAHNKSDASTQMTKCGRHPRTRR